MVKTSWKRNSIIFITSLIVIFLLSGCGTTATKNDVQGIETPGDTDVPGQSDTAQTVDVTMCLEKVDASRLDDQELPYQRIVVDSNAVAYYMSLYDVPLVGIPTTSKPLPEEYKGLPEIGIAVNPNIETIVSLNPDLFVGDRVLEHFTKEPLEKHGITTFYLDNSSYDAVFDSIMELGQLLNREEIGAAFIECQKEKEAAILADIDHLHDKKVALILGTAEYYKLGTANSYLGSILEKIGVVNIAGKIGETDQDYVTFSKESLIAENPDYIFALAHGGNPAEVKKSFEQEFADPIWDEITAKKENQIFYLDSTNFPVTGTINNVETMEAIVNLLTEGVTANGSENE